MSRPDSATSSSSSSTSSHQTTSSAQLRKIKKPMIERRRPERINVCLNQLKSLVLEALKKNESSYSKMEKADILEMTVAHLKSLQHRHPENDPKVRDHDPATRYVLGFRECATEVEKYLTTLNPVDRPGVEVLSALIQYLRDRTEDVQKAVRSGSDQLHPVMESSGFGRAESLMQQLHAAHQPSKIVEYECNEFQPSTGANCFRMSDSSAPDSATNAATRYILGQLPYLQHPYQGLTSSLTISEQSHFATSATSLTLARREQAQSPTHGDEFPRALGVRIPRGSGMFQHLRDSQISPDSGISLDSPIQVYRSKSVKSESVVEFSSSQSAYKVKPRSQLETMESGPSSDRPWRPW